MTKPIEKIDGWWFAAGDTLRHGDCRPIVIGVTHSLKGKIVLCKHALHASRDPLDALNHAPGPYLYRVRLWGDVQEESDKLGARHREYLATRDATAMLRRFARDQASSVLHLWNAPQIVKDYLATGDENLRPAAEAAARGATWAARAAEAAAWAARGATWAARGATWAARGATWAAWAARGAARETWAARGVARACFEKLVAELFAE